MWRRSLSRVSRGAFGYDFKDPNYTKFGSMSSFCANYETNVLKVCFFLTLNANRLFFFFDWDSLGNCGGRRASSVPSTCLADAVDNLGGLTPLGPEYKSIVLHGASLCIN